MFNSLGCQATVFTVLVLTTSTSAIAQIPSADVLKHREAEISYGIAGAERNVSKGYAHSWSGTMGVLDKFELSFSNDFLGGSSYDVKFQIFESEPTVGGWALSVGAAGREGVHGFPFVVGRYDLNGFRLHGGYTNSDGEGRAFLGSDFPVYGPLSGKVSVLSGRHAWAWGGLSFEVPNWPGVSVTFKVGVPGVRSDGIQHSLEMAYGFKF